MESKEERKKKVREGIKRGQWERKKEGGKLFLYKKNAFYVQGTLVATKKQLKSRKNCSHLWVTYFPAI